MIGAVGVCANSEALVANKNRTVRSRLDLDILVLDYCDFRVRLMGKTTGESSADLQLTAVRRDRFASARRQITLGCQNIGLVALPIQTEQNL